MITDAARDVAIDKAIDVARPLFAYHHWTWHGSDDVPSKERMRKSLNESWDLLLSSPDNTSAGSGRFVLIREGHGVRIALDLSKAYDATD